MYALVSMYRHLLIHINFALKSKRRPKQIEKADTHEERYPKPDVLRIVTEEYLTAKTFFNHAK